MLRIESFTAGIYFVFLLKGDLLLFFCNQLSVTKSVPVLNRERPVTGRGERRTTVSTRIQTLSRPSDENKSISCGRNAKILSKKKGPKKQSCTRKLQPKLESCFLFRVYEGIGVLCVLPSHSTGVATNYTVHQYTQVSRLRFIPHILSVYKGLLDSRRSLASCSNGRQIECCGAML